MNPGYIFTFVVVVLPKAVFASSLRDLLSSLVKLNSFENQTDAKEILTPLGLHQVHLAASTDLSSISSQIRPFLVAFLAKKEAKILAGKKWITVLLNHLHSDSKGILRNRFEGPVIEEKFEELLASETKHQVLVSIYRGFLMSYGLNSNNCEKIRKCVVALDSAPSVDAKIKILDDSWDAFWVFDHRFSGIYIHILAFALLNIQHQTYALDNKNCFKDVQRLWQKFNMRKREYFPTLFALSQHKFEIEVHRDVSNVFSDLTLRIRRCHVFHLPGKATYSVIIGNARTNNPQSPRDFELKNVEQAANLHLLIYVSEMSDEKLSYLIFFLKNFFAQSCPLDARRILKILNDLV